MGIADMKGSRFADSQEYCFQSSKRSNMWSAVMLGGRCADVQEYSFQIVTLWDLGCDELQGSLFADCH